MRGSSPPVIALLALASFKLQLAPVPPSQLAIALAPLPPQLLSAVRARPSRTLAPLAFAMTPGRAFTLLQFPLGHALPPLLAFCILLPDRWHAFVPR